MDETQEEIDLIKLIKAVFSKFWLLVLVGLIFASVSFIHSYREFNPVYSSTNKIYVYSRPNNKVTVVDGVETFEKSVSDSVTNNYIITLQSDDLFEYVAYVLNYCIGKPGYEYVGSNPYSPSDIRNMVSCQNGEYAGLLNITVTSSNRYLVALVNNAIVDRLPHEILKLVSNGSFDVIYQAPVQDEIGINFMSFIKKALIAGFLGGALAAAVVAVLALINNYVETEDDLNSSFPSIPVIGVIPRPAKNKNAERDYEEE